MRQYWIPAFLMFAIAGCAARPATEAQAPVGANSILARSVPADGSNVIGPINNLILTFSKPVRLLEVTVDGPDGLSPMMITAAGETISYSVPLPGLGAGSYRASWKASAAGRQYIGVIAFTVRG